MAKKERKGKGLWLEFKQFINKGNAFMLAVGVVIGGAFGAIVTAFVNILLSLATFWVPGGLKGLVWALPGLYDAQKGLLINGEYVQSFSKGQYDEIAKAIGKAAGITEDGAALLYGSEKINANYTAHGGKFFFNGAALVDLGALLTAIISFLVIALVLFIIVKAVSVAAAKKAELEAKAREEYYKKHPEERPVEPEPGVPEPTELDVLKEIRDALVKKEKAKQ